MLCIDCPLLEGITQDEDLIVIRNDEELPHQGTLVSQFYFIKQLLSCFSCAVTFEGCFLTGQRFKDFVFEYAVLKNSVICACKIK